MVVSRAFGKRWTLVIRLLVGAVMVSGGSLWWATAHAAPARAGTTVTLWSGLSGPDQTGFKKIIDGFNSSQSAVTVNYDQNSFSGYGTKLATALSAGQAPNMWTLDAASSATYMSQGQMTPVDSLISKSKILKPSNFAKTNWNAYKNNSAAQNRAAIKFIEYYETHSIEMAKVGDVPVYQPVIKNPAFKTLGGVVVAAKELKYGVYNPPIPSYDDHWLYDDALWPVLRGQSTDIQGDLNKAAAAITNHIQNGSG